MKTFLTFIDLFGEPVKIYLNKQSEVKTTFGGILSVIMLIIIVICSWYVGRDIVYKVSPFSYDQYQVLDNYPPLNINATTFPFSVVLTDLNNVPISNNSIIQLKLYYILTEANAKDTFVTNILSVIDLELCTKENFVSITDEQFSSAKLDTTFCIKQQNFTLEGFWGENKIQYIQLSALMCDYDKNPDFCAGYEEIKDFIGLNGLAFNIYYIDGAVDIKNFSYPLKNYVGNIYKYFDSNKFKLAEYFLRSDSIITDSGIIFEDLSYLNHYTLSEIHTDYVDFDPISKQLLSLIIYSSNMSNVTYRKYIKAAEVLADVGGLIEIVVLIFTFGNLGFARIRKFETVINEIFKFNFQKQSMNGKFERIDANKSHAPFNGSKLNYNSNVSKFSEFKKFSTANIKKHKNNFLSDYSHPNYYQKIYNQLKNKEYKEHLNLNFKDYMNLLTRPLCKGRHLETKYRIYYNGQNKIKEYFDFINIIRKLEEFEDLKTVILSPNQRFLFELNAYPKIEGSFTEKINHLKTMRANNLEESIKQFLDRFQTNINTEFDNNLLSFLLDSNINE